MTETPKQESYHHGNLKEALLDSAEKILEKEGVNNLTLRAVARETGVSHAAPKNHFANLTELLSALATRGYKKFSKRMAETREEDLSSPKQQENNAGLTYVSFAIEHPHMFQLMFRSEKLDYEYPPLREAADEAFQDLGATSGVTAEAAKSDRLTLGQAAQMTATWSIPHGIAMLILDGQLAPVLRRLPDDMSALDIAKAIFKNTAPQSKN